MNTILNEKQWNRLCDEIDCAWAEAHAELSHEGSYLDEHLMRDLAEWVTAEMHPELDDCQRDYLVTTILEDHAIL